MSKFIRPTGSDFALAGRRSRPARQGSQVGPDLWVSGGAAVEVPRAVAILARGTSLFLPGDIRTGSRLSSGVLLPNPRSLSSELASSTGLGLALVLLVVSRIHELGSRTTGVPTLTSTLRLSLWFLNISSNRSDSPSMDDQTSVDVERPSWLCALGKALPLYRRKYKPYMHI